MAKLSMLDYIADRSDFVRKAVLEDCIWDYSIECPSQFSQEAGFILDLAIVSEIRSPADDVVVTLAVYRVIVPIQGPCTVKFQRWVPTPCGSAKDAKYLGQLLQKLREGA